MSMVMQWVEDINNLCFATMETENIMGLYGSSRALIESLIAYCNSAPINVILHARCIV